MQVLQFPSQPARRDVLAERSGLCSLSTIGNRLGLIDATLATLIRYVRALNVERGFPDTVTPRLLKGHLVEGPAAITHKSMWRRDAVDQWFDNALPPTIAAGLDRAEAARVDALVAARLGQAA